MNSPITLSLSGRPERRHPRVEPNTTSVDPENAARTNAHTVSTRTAPLTRSASPNACSRALTSVGKPEPQRAVDDVGVHVGGTGPLQGLQPGQLVDAVEQLGVVGLRRRPIGGEVLVQPEDVVLVRTAGLQLGDLAPALRVVGAEDLLDHPDDARVEQRVVVREHEALARRPELQQRRAPQRRLTEVEAAQPVLDAGTPPSSVVLLRRR